MSFSIPGLNRVSKPLVAVVAALLVLTVVLVVRGGNDQRTVTAHFSRAVSLFKGSEVRILGVRVGKVTAVVPEGSTVRVDMTYDADYALPADVKAVIMTPTLTADRFVQLTPAYTKGPKLPDGASIDVQDTATPVELDRIYRSLADLTTALGPNGVNEDGTLNHVLTAGDKFLKGEGRKGNETIINLSRALKTFGDGSGELFGTVRALDDFSQTLAANDQVVSQFIGHLGEVSQQLGAEKDALYAALDNLARVLGKVESFVRDNRSLLTSDVKDLTRVVGVLASERAALETILEIGPMAMGNLVNAWEPVTGTIGSRVNVKANVQGLHTFLCSLVQAGGLPSASTACKLFKTLLGPLGDALNYNPASAGSPARYGSAPTAGSLQDLLGGAA